MAFSAVQELTCAAINAAGQSFVRPFSRHDGGVGSARSLREASAPSAASDAAAPTPRFFVITPSRARHSHNQFPASILAMPPEALVVASCSPAFRQFWTVGIGVEAGRKRGRRWKKRRRARELDSERRGKTRRACGVVEEAWGCPGGAGGREIFHTGCRERSIECIICLGRRAKSLWDLVQASRWASAWPGIAPPHVGINVMLPTPPSAPSEQCRRGHEGEHQALKPPSGTLTVYCVELSQRQTDVRRMSRTTHSRGELEKSAR
jgi:hypothetical protein